MTEDGDGNCMLLGAVGREEKGQGGSSAISGTTSWPVLVRALHRDVKAGMRERYVGPERIVDAACYFLRRELYRTEHFCTLFGLYNGIRLHNRMGVCTTEAQNY